MAGLYSAVDEDTALEAVDAAWDAGIRYFDTAPHYGLGLSERRLGRALAARPRDDYVVSTKVGRLLVPNPECGHVRDRAEGFDVAAAEHRVWDFSADGVRRSLESSLGRLGMDRVDAVLIHDPDHHWRQAIEKAYPALDELRHQGVIGAVGAGMNQWQMLADFVQYADLDFVLVAGRYTLLDQSALDVLLRLCADRGVSAVAASVFNSGLLATAEPQPHATFDYAPVPAAMLERAKRIAAVCASHDVSLPQAALAFPLAHPAVVSVLVGMRSASEVTTDVALAASPVPPGLWHDLADAGLLRRDAPTPAVPPAPPAPPALRVVRR
jgi:D-threo-aldose 1-dehydrogenase